MANNVWFYPIGVGDAFTVKHFFVHCLFHVDGREFIVDAPPYMGKMWAENNPTGGATFRFTLPAVPNESMKDA